MIFIYATSSIFGSNYLRLYSRSTPGQASRRHRRGQIKE